ncbi:fibronectin type III domain-containing protein [Actinoplanes solisilvae]|uniref:fibronectin type III domain-containing protein n=1 Tax=Actinoplanes solisilvae TaxID=2486853 RepID=UPI000FD7B943|nr:hypothetical protein [Actinoplanes solisilvae]
MAFVSESSPLAAVWQRAHALVSAGDLAGARAVLEHGVELGRVNLSEDDPGVLRTAFELGVVLQRGDDPVGARRVLEEAYAAGQWRLGDADPLMVRISHDIGVVAEELGNRHEARKAFSRVAEFGPAVLGDEHPAVVKARAYLGADTTGRGGSRSGEGQVATPPVSRFGGEEQIGPVGSGRAGGTARERPLPLVVGPPAVEQRVGVGPVTAPLRGALEEPTVLQPVVVPRLGAERGTHGQRKGLGVFAAVAAGVAAVFAVAALVVVLAGQVGGSGGESDVPTLVGDAPLDVRLSDRGSAIGVSWKDPTAGTVSFMVIMGRPGVELKPAGTLGPGQTSFEMSGLNPSLDYCFAVVAVYQRDRFATSPQTCTRRANATPR